MLATRTGDLARPSRAPDGSGSDDTSRQPNTHSTASREVRYPWHPWFGRSVAVYEVIVRYGRSVCRCGLEEERTRRAVEVPTWMFKPVACARGARDGRADPRLRRRTNRLTGWLRQCR